MPRKPAAPPARKTAAPSAGISNLDELRTRADGDDLGGKLDTLFRALDLPPDERRGNAYARLAHFPYVNGELFKGRLEPCGFDATARGALLACAVIDWAGISPDIFGSLFQAIVHFDDEAAHGKTKKCREFGAHYTSEANILKLIGPPFLDPLKAEFTACKREPKKLRAYLARLRGLRFFDPACGCGNFLVVAYRELRLLEEDALDRLRGIRGQTVPFPECNVDQFYGIEIDPSAAKIATVALWLTDYQMNRRAPGNHTRLPLKTRARIACGNALRQDWRQACPDASFIMGNPPFIGHQWRTPEQMNDMAQGARIRFAHRTFRWNNEGRGHCVIVGFGVEAAVRPRLFHYPDLNDDPVQSKARNINPCLVDAPDAILPSRTATPVGLPQLIKGSQPTDGGHLILTDAERAALLAAEPGAQPWLRRYVGGDELINGGWRWCLRLKGVTEDRLAALPGVAERVRGVAAARLKSPTASVREFAARPTLFTQDRQPDRDYLGLPEVSSENRRFVPIAFLKAEVVASNQTQIIQAQRFSTSASCAAAFTTPGCAPSPDGWKAATATRPPSTTTFPGRICPPPARAPLPQAGEMTMRVPPSKPPRRPCSTPAPCIPASRSPGSTTPTPCPPTSKTPTTRWTMR